MMNIILLKLLYRDLSDVNKINNKAGSLLPPQFEGIIQNLPFITLPWKSFTDVLNLSLA